MRRMTVEFAVALRGYDRFKVDEILGLADDALASESAAARAAARAALTDRDITIVLRGYDMAAVDAAFDQRLRLLDSGEVVESVAPAAAPDPPAVAGQRFTVVLRGYDRTAVDAVLAQADAAVTSDSDVARAAARDALRSAAFPIVWRGYDRGQTDRHLENRLARLT